MRFAFNSFKYCSPFVALLFDFYIYIAFPVSRSDKPSCKLLYVTPERIAGNLSFQDVLKSLHRKVRFQVYT